jgi:uncharacterized membrane protein
MRASPLLIVHVAAGAAGLISGYVALTAAKGAPLHRKAGTVFVYTMLPMAMSATVMAAFMGVAPAINIPAALVTSYMVITAWTAVRRPSGRGRRLDVALMWMARGVGVACFVVAAAIASGGGRQAGMAYPLVIFGLTALLGARGDRLMLLAGGFSGAPRLRRHVWRMCFALFVAAGSFFLGQADEFPAAFRIGPLLAVPVLAVLAAMGYWLWRLRAKPGAKPRWEPAVDALRMDP